MIDNIEARRQISDAFGESVDGLVRERMEGLVEEPDITSRVGQRLEDSFNGRIIGNFKVRVISETITSHGSSSLEKPMGTDLYFAVEVEDFNGNTTSKGILVQAKRSDIFSGSELSEQCRRMNLITKKGSVVWLYDKHGVKTVRSTDIVNGHVARMSSPDFFDRVFECQIGDKRKVPSGRFGNRPALRAFLKALGAQNAAWIKLEEVR